MAENLRHANCYHWHKETGTCSLNGCPCDDIIDGQDCECYKAKFPHCLGDTDGIIENTGEKR